MPAYHYLKCKSTVTRKKIADSLKTWTCNLRANYSKRVLMKEGGGDNWVITAGVKRANCSTAERSPPHPPPQTLNLSFLAFLYCSSFKNTNGRFNGCLIQICVSDFGFHLTITSIRLHEPNMRSLTLLTDVEHTSRLR